MKRTQHSRSPQGRAEAASARRAEAASGEPATASFPIVGVGASAGGLEAFAELLSALPPRALTALVFVQHLDPKHPSVLAELLARSARIPVIEAKHGTRVEPSRVYVIPSNANLTIARGVLEVAPRATEAGSRGTIDHFLRSLADDAGNRAIGVVLSGNASDGALGLAAIKAAGGITFAQDPKSAKFTGMPLSAAASGMVDFVLTPKAIARELARLARHPYLREADQAPPAEAAHDERSALDTILRILRRESGVDFTHYRQTTIRRRIHRRMTVHKLESLEAYRRHLQEHPAEATALYNDLLINVTGFFRNPGSFRRLQQIVFRRLAQRAAGTPIRVWAPGCATGEEAYSLAMALLESLDKRSGNIPVQIFGTDVSETAVARARTGIYPENIELDVSPERLRRFFVKVDSHYQVRRDVRELCVFARHNLLKDPPFSNVDVIACRNVLIYLEPVLQRRVLSILHYALKPTGVLLLGASETTGPLAALFAVVDKAHKLYAKKATSAPLDLGGTGFTRTVAETPAGKTATAQDGRDGPAGLGREADRIVLARYSPPAVLVNDAMEILQFRGQTGRYLEPASGQASLNVLKMAREGLLMELRYAISRVRKAGTPVRREGLRVRRNGTLVRLDLEVIPVRGPDGERNYLVLFEDVSLPRETRSKKAGPRGPGLRRGRDGAQQEVTGLRQELAATKDFLQSIVAEREAANESLQTANEEILSSNEELQSTNEELETAKEELQSTNEELTTVNEELQHRNAELQEVNDDLRNLIGSIDMPILMVGADLRIRRFTTLAAKLFNLLPGDVGRSLRDLRAPLAGVDLVATCAHVIDTVMPSSQEVRNEDGRWHSLRVRPYRTADDRLDGAVIVLVDVTGVKESLAEATAAREYAEAIVDTVREPLLVLDASLCVVSASRSFYRTFTVAPEETVNRLLYDLGNGQWDIPRLRTLLDDVLRNHAFEDFEVESEFERLGRRTMLLNASPVERAGRAQRLILLAIRDVTERRRAEAEARSSGERYRALVGATTAVVWTADAEGAFVEPQRSWEAYTGQDWEQHHGRHWIDAFHAEDRETVDRTLEEAVAEGRPFEIEGRLWSAQRRTHSEYRDIVMRGVPIRDLTEVVSEWIGAVTDVHEAAQAERERRIRTAAEAASRAKDEFLAAISHELRTPLTAIVGWVRMLKSGGLDAARTTRALDVVERNAKLQAQLIEDLLDISRIVSGKLWLELRPVDVVPLVQAAVENLRPAAESKAVGLESMVEGSSCLVLCDPSRLQQAVANLLSNAIKFTPRGGSVRVRLEPREAHLDIAIADTGQGITAELLPQLFTRFRQDAGASTRAYSGLGLGLAITRHVVELHGGSVRAESPGPGQGATFTITLPLAPRGAEAAAESSAPTARVGPDLSLFSSATLDGIRVLVVDDEPDVRDLLVAVLERCRAEVTAVASATEALQAFEQVRPHVLVSDIAMAGEDGYTLLRKVRTLPAERGGRTPAIALTAHARSEDQELAVSAGYDVHVPKPIEPAELAEVVARLAGRGGRSGSTARPG